MAGKITWARQLFRRIHEPMRVFKTYPEILKVTGTNKYFVCAFAKLSDIIAKCKFHFLLRTVALDA